jgi:hypothetical protein
MMPPTEFLSGNRRECRAATDEQEDFFDMADLPPDPTGLPMVVWVPQRGRAQHDVRVKVSLIHGRRMDLDQTSSVSVRPSVGVVAGPSLRAEDLDCVRRWVDLDRQTIIGYWEGNLYTNELIAQLRRI